MAFINNFLLTFQRALSLFVIIQYRKAACFSLYNVRVAHVCTSVLSRIRRNGIVKHVRNHF
jgi:hypothetical protein